jgi:hypothetical protein
MMTMNDDIETILDEFDFYKVEKVMYHLGWEWLGKGIPSIGDMRRWSRDLLTRAAEGVRQEPADYYCASGGFEASAFLLPGDSKVYLTLRFVVSSWDNLE